MKTLEISCSHFIYISHQGKSETIARDCIALHKQSAAVKEKCCLIHVDTDWVTRAYSCAGGYIGLHGVTWGYMELHGLTCAGGYIGLHGLTAVLEVKWG